MSKKSTHDKKVGDNAKFYTISAAVYGVLEDIQVGVERFNQFLKFGLDGAREMNFDFTHEIHFEEVDIKPNKQFDFPCDMVDWTKIGFRIGSGIRVFTQDDTIPLVDKCAPLTEALPSSDSIDFIGSDGYYNSGGDHFYGMVMPYNYAGYFKVDYRNRVVDLRDTVSGITKAYIEFITDGINYSGQTVIAPQAFRGLQLYIHWQRKEYDDRFSQGEADRAKRLYESHMGNVLVRQMNLSLDDIKEALRSHYKQTVKG